MGRHDRQKAQFSIIDKLPLGIPMIKKGISDGQQTLAGEESNIVRIIDGGTRVQISDFLDRPITIIDTPNRVGQEIRLPIEAGLGRVTIRRNRQLQTA